MIKTIIFDFGDVFINLDKDATLREITKHFGKLNMSKDIEAINQSYEKGDISSETFINFYKSYFNTNHNKALIASWNAIILDFPEYRLEFIITLAASKQYKLILLSNTNALHIEQVIENMTLERYVRFKNCFDMFYLSHEIHLRKPNLDIYEFVLSQNSLTAKETLFIDDTYENTKAAAQLGIYTWHINPETEDIVNLFNIKNQLF